MCQLHIFNPSHDEALAANSPYYYPARAARTLGADLAVLPAWWAQEGDWVLIPDEVECPTEDFTHHGVRFLHWTDLRHLASKSVDKISPWGWDPLLVHQLRKAGFCETLLPDGQQLSNIRQLSSRQTAVRLLQAIHQDFPQTTGTSFWCTDETELWKQVAQQGNMMLKAPWSSSGRGVFAVHPDISENIRQRVQRILKEQGAVEAEPLYERCADFAVEFEATSENVTYRGLSVFATTETGAYTGNVVAQETQLYQQLPPAIQELLPPVIDRLAEHLHRLIADQYEGPLGIDMMTVRKEDGTLGLHPCVEINLRRTMGHVALDLRSLIPHGSTGIYTLRPISKKQENDLLLTPQAQKMEAVLTLC